MIYCEKAEFGQIYTKAQLENINSITIPGFDINHWDGIVVLKTDGADSRLLEIDGLQ